MSAAWNIVNGKRIQFTHWHVITAKLFERFWLVFGASAHTLFTRCFICTTENVLILRRCFALFENLYDRRRYTKSYTHQPNLHINRMNLYVRCHTMEHPRVDRLSTPFNGLSWKSHQYNLNSCINFRGIAIHWRRNWIWGCSRFAAYSYFRFKLQLILETVPSKCPKPHTTLSAHTHTCKTMQSVDCYKTGISKQKGKFNNRLNALLHTTTPSARTFIIYQMRQ